MRTMVEQEYITLAMGDIERTLNRRLIEKGPGTFASRHEILGVLQEEYTELSTAVREPGIRGFKHELLDVAVGAIFGLACIRAGLLDW